MEQTEQKIMKERHKTYFHKGDVVKFKGFDGPNQPDSLIMKVEQVVWKTNDDGSLFTNNGRKQIQGILVGWHNDRNDWVIKEVDSRAIYKIEHEGNYFLHEAKKYFFSKGLTNIVEDINKLLDKVQ
jgi:hypothetical protein